MVDKEEVDDYAADHVPEPRQVVTFIGDSGQGIRLSARHGVNSKLNLTIPNLFFSTTGSTGGLRSRI